MLVDYVHVSTSDTTPPPSSGGSALKSNFSGRCIDIPAAAAADGARLQMFGCNGTAAQAVDDQQRRHREGHGQMHGPGRRGAHQRHTDPAGHLQRQPGPAVHPVRRGELVNVSANKCVDVTSRNGANGAPLQLWDCNGGSNQKWTRA